MDKKYTIVPVTRLRTHSLQLIHEVLDTKKPIVITQNGEAVAVLQDIDSFQRQRDTLLLTRLALQGAQDYHQGNTLSHSEVKRHFEDTLAGTENIE